MTQKPVAVAAAIIKRGDLILIAQRKKDSWLEPNKWEFPGGKIEQSEHPEDCLVREIKEELDLDISIKELFTVHSHTYHKEGKEYPVQLYIYLADWNQGQIKNLDCQDSRWVSVDQLTNYEFVEADTHVLHQLTTRLKTLG
ncbi:MAG: (deoxy)nucleoside triphosphate pyrophosphohydrolase [Methanobacteriota archaeon]